MRSSGWRVPGATGAVVLAAALAAAGTGREAAGAGPRPGGELRIVRPTDAVALDPQLETTAPGAWVYGNVLETLLVLDPGMRIAPGLAARHEVISPTRLRLWLRRNVRFHDGTPLDAAAVRFSFERALHGRPPARWTTVVTIPLSVEVVDDLTLDVVTPEPHGALRHVLAMVYTGIVSPAAVRRLGPAFSRAPVGTGPFRFVEWRTNDRIVIERNPDYWGPRAHVDRVVFRVVPEEGARMIALQAGDADMVLQPAPAQLSRFRRDPGYTVHEVDGLRVVFAGMNTAAPPLDDPLVRRALIHAVDRPALLANVLEGAALPVRSVIAPGVFGFRDMDLDRRYPFDPGRARALLDQAGWVPGPDGVRRKGGVRLTLDWLTVRGRFLKDGELTEAVQAMLRDVGVDARLDFRDWAALLKEVRGDTLVRHLFTWGFVTVTGDADYALHAMFHTRRPGTTGNMTRFSDPRVDRLLSRARVSVDQEERARLYGEVQDILADDLVWIPLYTTKEVALTRSHVQGFALHPVDYNLALRSVWLDR